MHDTTNRCTEYKHEVDEFTAGAEGWRYWSDGTSLLPLCPACARDVGSLTTLSRALHRLAVGVATQVVRMLRLDPVAMAAVSNVGAGRDSLRMAR
jgi:hypothetical protein